MPDITKTWARRDWRPDCLSFYWESFLNSILMHSSLGAIMQHDESCCLTILLLRGLCSLYEPGQQNLYSWSSLVLLVVLLLFVILCTGMVYFKTVWTRRCDHAIQNVTVIWVIWVICFVEADTKPSSSPSGVMAKTSSSPWKIRTRASWMGVAASCEQNRGQLRSSLM